MKRERPSENGKIWLKREMRGYRGFISFLAILVGFSSLFSLAFAYLVRYLINNASAGNEQKLWIFAFILLGLLFLRIFLKTCSSYFMEKLRAKIISKLRIKIFSKILKSEYSLIQNYHSGDMLNRLTTDIQAVANDTAGLLPTLVGLLVQCIGAIIALMTIDPIFTIVYAVCGIIFCGITALFRKQFKKTHKEVLQEDGKFRSFMQEGLTSIMTLKSYSVEDKATLKAESFADVYFDKRMKRNILHSIMTAVFSTITNFGLILAIIWCGVSVLHGNNDYGSILSVILLLMQLQQPFASFSSIIPTYYSMVASGERLAEIDDLPEEKAILRENNDAKAIYQELTKISLNNISFTYGRNIIFEKANYQIEKGKIICLKGASGAGKSTIFKLLLNVYKPTEGNIYLQFKDTTDVVLTEENRNLFAYVPQGHFLFSGTIYDNLTFFSEETNKEILEEKIQKAIQTACAEFVWDLPEKLQTQLSEGGAGLSEGQLQRLAVARAILSDRPILLLDEATSALDNETEKALLENIRQLKDKTCLIVTHRLAALSIADEIITIQDGKIIK